MRSRRLSCVAWILVLGLSTACVPRSRYRALSEAEERSTRSAWIDHAALATRADRLSVDLDAASTRASGLADALAAEQAGLVAAQASCASEKAGLLKDKSRLRASMAELSLALEDLERRRRLAEARVAAFHELLERFGELIDAGTLEVKIVEGRMVVQMATDVLFASGQATLSDDGATALDQVAAVLAQLPERVFQVEGHTDDVPIRTQRFPSNWELASARALGVTRRLIGGGVAPERISGASFGEHRPVASNETREGRAANRRIEIVVVPDLTDLPGAGSLEASVQEAGALP